MSSGSNWDKKISVGYNIENVTTEEPVLATTPELLNAAGHVLN